MTHAQEVRIVLRAIRKGRFLLTRRRVSKRFEKLARRGRIIFRVWPRADKYLVDIWRYNGHLRYAVDR